MTDEELAKRANDFEEEHGWSPDCGYEVTYEELDDYGKIAIVNRAVEDEHELVYKVVEWGKDKGLNDPKAQLNKVMEELGEIAHEITRNRVESNPALVDALGDTIVTIIILADICGYNFYECLGEAYKEIAGRKGKTENGTFIKEEE